MRSGRRQIPSFSLYGEHRRPGDLPLSTHVEDIPSRSSKYLGQIDAHRHLALSQCVLLTAGPAAVTLEESQLNCEGPSVVLVPAGTIHGFRFQAETRGFVLTVDLPRLFTQVCVSHQASIEALMALPQVYNLKARSALAARTAALLECLLRESRRPECLPESATASLACAILLTVADGCKTEASAAAQTGRDVERLNALRELIEDQFVKHWSVARYANRLKQSETSLNRLCRRLTGNTAFGLIQQRLALEARRQLGSGGASVGGVAHELGFKDLAYFSRFFRRHSGISPNEFKRGGFGGKVPARAAIVQ